MNDLQPAAPLARGSDLLALQALTSEEESTGRGDLALIVVNALFIAAGIFANLALEETGFDLPVVAMLFVLAGWVLFRAAEIDPESLRVTYLRTPNVDLTERVKSFAGVTGLDIPDAELPPGDHLIRVDIKDSDGRSGSTSFLLKISP